MPRYEIEYTYKEIDELKSRTRQAKLKQHKPVKTVIDADSFGEAEKAFPILVPYKIQPTILSIKLQDSAKS